MAIKKSLLEQAILSLLGTKTFVTLPEITEHIELSAESAADRRAIQRALNSLIESKKIEAKGKARARVYVPVSHVSPVNESAALLHYLSQPTAFRKPVSYNPDFLKSYRPNQTHYLDVSLKKKLHEVGRAEPIMRPAGTYARTILNRLLIDLSWNSSRLEGNTYSLLETQRLIEQGEAAEGKDVAEAQMILNHKN